ncbi:MAG: hypothetical protein ACLQLG_07045, partial [Thermoguttaceae bacterium]
NGNLARVALSDPDPMVRIGALDMLEGVPAAQIWPLASPLLSDPSRGVRIRAASLLAVVPTANLPPADRERFEGAAAEFVDAQRFSADRPEARAALGSFFAKRGRSAEAETEYKAALRMSPQYAPAAANLADLYRLPLHAAAREGLRGKAEGGRGKGEGRMKDEGVWRHACGFAGFSGWYRLPPSAFPLA